jgi:cell division septal protein FtsQ
MKHGFLFWLTFALAVLMCVYVAVRMSVVLLGMGGELSAVRRVSVYAVGCENTNTCVQAIAGRLDIAPGTKYIDLADALSRVASDPDIANAAVRRMPNGEIRVRAKMRKVVAAWTDGEKYYPLDNTGAPINRPSDTRPENILVFSGQVPDNIAQVSAALKRTPNLFYRIDRMEFIENRRWDMFLLNGIRIMLPEGDFAAAAKTIEKLNKQNMILDRKIKQLDMRDTTRPLVVISH